MKFTPGKSGNPSGRPKGARNKLSQKFLEDISKDWEEHGGEVLNSVRFQCPEAYLKTIAGLIVKDHSEVEDENSESYEEIRGKFLNELADLASQNKGPLDQ